MIFPEKVRLYRAYVLEDAYTRFIKNILDMGIAHIEDRYPLLGESILQRSDVNAKLQRIEGMMAKAEGIAKTLGIDFLKQEGPLLYSNMGYFDFDYVARKYSPILDRMEKKVLDIIKAKERDALDISRYDVLAWAANILLLSGIDNIGQIDGQLLFCTCGVLPKRNLEHLFAVLADKDACVEIEHISYETAAVFLVALPSDEKDIKQALTVLGFIPYDLAVLSEYGHLVEFVDEYEYMLWEKREEIAELNDVLGLYKNRFKAELSNIYRILLFHKRIYQNFYLTGKTQYIHILNLWVREADSAFFERHIKGELGADIFLDSVGVEESGMLPKDIPNSSSLPAWLGPFAQVVEMFGVPAYNEINPTLFIAVFFPLVYGIMFADIGHGAFLALLGAMLMRYTKQSFWGLLIPSGISAAFFGLLFGSVFGREDVIPAIFISPMEDIEGLLIFVLAVGCLWLLVGMVLNTINLWRNHGPAKALTGHNGILDILSYIGFISIFLMKGQPLLARIAIGVAPFALTTISRLILHIFSRFKGHHGGELIEVLYNPFEFFITMLSNTASFLRLAAFNFTHLSLMIVVFTIARLLKHPALAVPTLIFGNIFVILLEAFLVFIQSLRLSFYEFFSKFYRGNGRKFSPLTNRIFGIK